MQTEQKIYAPGSAKQVSEKLLKLNFPAAELIELIKKHERNGWITFGVTPRREIGPNKQTHTVWVDTWQPRAASAGDGFQKMRQAAGVAQRELPDAGDVPQVKGDGESVPF